MKYRLARLNRALDADFFHTFTVPIGLPATRRREGKTDSHFSYTRVITIVRRDENESVRKHINWAATVRETTSCASLFARLTDARISNEQNTRRHLARYQHRVIRSCISIFRTSMDGMISRYGHRTGLPPRFEMWPIGLHAGDRVVRIACLYYDGKWKNHYIVRQPRKTARKCEQ